MTLFAARACLASSTVSLDRVAHNASIRPVLSGDK